MKKLYSFIAIGVILSGSCAQGPTEDESTDVMSSLSTYIPVKLTTDLSQLTDSEKRMLPHLFAAADIMNDLFWQQAYGDKEQLLASIANPKLRKFAEIKPPIIKPTTNINAKSLSFQSFLK